MFYILLTISIIASIIGYYTLIKIIFKQDENIYYYNLIYGLIFSILLSFILFIHSYSVEKEVQNIYQTKIIILYIILCVFIPFIFSIVKYKIIKNKNKIDLSILRSMLLDMLNGYLVYFLAMIIFFISNIIIIYIFY